MHMNAGITVILSYAAAGLCAYIAFYAIFVLRKNRAIRPLLALFWLSLFTGIAAIINAFTFTGTGDSDEFIRGSVQGAALLACFVPFLWFIIRQQQRRPGKLLTLFTIFLPALALASAAAGTYAAFTGEIPFSAVDAASLIPGSRGTWMPDAARFASIGAALVYAIFLTFDRGHGKGNDYPPGLKRGVSILAACWLFDALGAAGVHRAPGIMTYGLAASSALFAHFFIRNIERAAAFQNALRESEELFREYFELGLVGSVITTPERGFVKINQRICDMMGYTMDEFMGFTWDRITHPDDLGPKNSEFLKLLAGEIDGYIVYRRYIRKDGSLLHAEVGVRAVRTEDGSLRYAIVHVQDVGELVRANESLQVKNRELEAANEELNATVEELVATNEEFEAQNEELIKTQMEVAKSEERFRALVENLTDIITIHDATGAITYESPSASRLLGYPSGYLVGKTPDILIHPADLAGAMEDLAEVYEKKNPLVPTLFRFRKADGSYLSMEALGKNMLDDPSIRGVVITSRDITDRLHALEQIRNKSQELEATNEELSATIEELVATNEEFEAQNAELINTQQDLAKSEERFRSLIQNLADVITVHDENGLVTYASPSSYTTLGYPPALMVGHHPLHFVHPDDLEYATRELHQLYEKNSPDRSTAFRFKCSDGSYRYLEAVGVNLLDHPAIRGVVITSRDVTERRHSMEDLRSSEKRYRTLIETTGEGYWQIDREYRTMDVNNALCEMLGYAREDILGKSPLEFVDGENREAFETQFARIPETARRSFDIILKHRSGRDVYTHFSATTVYDRNGALDGSFALITNTTERALAEMERERLNRHVLQVQRVEAVGTLAGGIAHDFNNLLTVINGNAQILIRRAQADSPMRTEASEILSAGQRAANLTRQLLAFSRKQIADVRVMDLNGTILELRKLYSRLIEEDITITTILHPGKLLVKADPAQIEQVTLNLLINARDAINEMRSESARKEIIVTTGLSHLTAAPMHGDAEFTPGTYASMSIHDTGSGMTEEVKARIFEPFFTTKEVGKGTGLGLSTVYGNLKQNAGAIDVVSAPLQGTTFIVYLPVADDEVREAQSRDGDERAHTGTERVLFVEDDDGVRLFALKALELGGYRVASAHDGMEALSVFGADPAYFDLIITDVVMPNLNGSELVRRIRAMRPGIKYIFTTGYPDRYLAEPDMINAPCIRKPYTAETLLSKIRETLDDGKNPRAPSP
ncbi:MAG: PAS domain S-box protein [Spirochaetes bacterium]|nr:MAG: PAS domain S-box protein [Spirochaetota bacterium]